MGSLETQTSQKNVNAQVHDGEKKRKKLKPPQGHYQHVCKILGCNSQKRRGHWHVKEFGVSCLNRPVVRTRKRQDGTNDVQIELKKGIEKKKKYVNIINARTKAACKGNTHTSGSQGARGGCTAETR